MSIVFTPVALLEALQRLPVPQRYCLAYSGGGDSQVLLHALCVLRPQLPVSELHAIHIDHGLHAESRQWAEQCRAQCTARGVSITVTRVQLARQRGQSLEAQAREARYRALGEALAPGDLLLLAQHEDDQAETLLLQLLRGSGAQGLAGMPGLAAFAGGWLARPLLAFSRAALQAYARAEGLTWIEDPANADTRYDRNYLRHAILPTLQQRWPGATGTLARAARHQADASRLLRTLAAQDYAGIRTAQAGILRIDTLQRLDTARQRNVLRYWLQQICALPLPSTAQLERILAEVIPAARDATPRVHWPGGEVRRFQGQLYAMAPLPVIERGWQARWDGRTSLALPDGSRLQAQPAEAGLAAEVLAQGVIVRYRRGGEVCRLPGRAHHSELKKLLQAWGVPPWQRARMPLLFVEGELAQIVGYSACEPFCAAGDTRAVQISHCIA